MLNLILTPERRSFLPDSSSFEESESALHEEDEEAVDDEEEGVHVALQGVEVGPRVNLRLGRGVRHDGRICDRIRSITIKRTEKVVLVVTRTLLELISLVVRT